MVRGIIGNIPVKLDYDYLQHRDNVKANKLLIFTGPIDEFFNYKFGKLKYAYAISAGWGAGMAVSPV